MKQSAPAPIALSEPVETPVQGGPAQTDLQNQVPDAASHDASPQAPAQVMSWVVVRPIPFYVRNNDLTLQEFSIY